MTKYDESEGLWRTVGGRRIFIKKGQDLSSAMKESGKFKTHKQEVKDKLKKGREELAKSYSDEELKNEISEYKKTGSDPERQKELENELKSRSDKKVKEEDLDEQMEKLANKMDEMSEKGEDDTEEFRKLEKEYDDLLEKQKSQDKEFLDKESKKESKSNSKINPELQEEAKQMMDDIKYLDPEEEGYEEALADIKESYKDLRKREGDNQSPQSKEIEEALKQLDEENIKSKVAESSKGAVKELEEKELKEKYMNIPEEERVKAYEEGKNWKDLVKEYNKTDSKGSMSDDAFIEKARKSGMTDEEIASEVYKKHNGPESNNTSDNSIKRLLAKQKKEESLAKGDKDTASRFEKYEKEFESRTKTTKQVANEKFKEKLQPNTLRNLDQKDYDKVWKNEDSTEVYDYLTQGEKRKLQSAYRDADFGNKFAKEYIKKMDNEAAKRFIENNTPDYIKDYIKEHPNTNKTMNDLIKEEAEKKKKRSGK